MNGRNNCAGIKEELKQFSLPGTRDDGVHPLLLFDRPAGVFPSGSCSFIEWVAGSRGPAPVRTISVNRSTSKSASRAISCRMARSTS